MQKAKSRLIRIFIILIILLFPANMAVLYSQTTPAYGDVNNDGAISIVDALMIAQYYVGIIPPVFYTSAADVNINGSIDIVDALLVAQYSVGLITTLPYGQKTPTRTATSTTPTPYPDHITGNPFSGAKWYVNPDWSAKAAAGGGSAIAGYNTGIWLETIASITAGTGLRGHMNNALAQGANLILLVLHNIPNRSCMEPVLTGELYFSQDGYNRYKTEYIDPITAILSDPAYKTIRIVTIVEPASLVYMISGSSTRYCMEAGNSPGYVACIQYALNALHAIPNTYNYMDIAGSHWLGWESNMPPAVTYIGNAVKGTTAGAGSIDGFASNVTFYNPLEETYLTDPLFLVGGSPVRSALFYEYNNYFDELDYVQAMYTAFRNSGFPDTMGMLIDTSRNGWGGAGRPVRISTSADLNTYVDESRIDRRTHRGNWCNVKNAGIGARPQAAPAANIDAYIWAKPPGESDGISVDGVTDPNDPSMKFVAMCDPNGISRYNPDFGTDAMSGCPHRGYWNQAEFTQLLQYAYPPVN